MPRLVELSAPIVSKISRCAISTYDREIMPFPYQYICPGCILPHTVWHNLDQRVIVMMTIPVVVYCGKIIYVLDDSDTFLLGSLGTAS